MLIPKVVNIENVRGYCTAKCGMCSISSVQDKHIMTGEAADALLNRLSPYADRIETVEFVGYGESMLDPALDSKIAAAKAASFANVGLITNCSSSAADFETMMHSGLDFLVLSIDSLYPEQYEAIRSGLSYERVLATAHEVIAIRNARCQGTRIYIRMIECDSNIGIWDEYTNYWKDFLNFNGGDMILHFPKHNYADSKTVIKKTCTCSYPSESMSITAHGDIGFCCIDVNADFFQTGNAITGALDPIEIYNNESFRSNRILMNSGKINQIHPCKFCNIPLKRLARKAFQPS